MHGRILRSDLQALLDKYGEIRNKFSALHVFSEMQQRSLECERVKLEITKNKLKNTFGWIMKREEHYKVSLNRLEKENEQLHSDLVATRREYERDKLLSNDKVSTLQGEIDFLREQIMQLKDKHKQQLMSQDKRHEDEILKYKRLLDNADAKLLLKQNVMKKSDSKRNQGTKNKLRNEIHPAFMNDNDENMEKKKNRVDKLPALKIVKDRKRRKLFHNDNDIIVDIV